jgi:hypothetical protein
MVIRSDQLFENLERHLLHQSEPELLLLKGHLILEQCLNHLLESYLNDASSLEKLNLTFARKLDLLVALGHRSFSIGSGGAEHIRELNRIRNRLAHTLDFAPHEKELKRWACAVLEYTPKSINRRSTYLNTVRRAFLVLSAFLTGVAETRLELRPIK